MLSAEQLDAGWQYWIGGKWPVPYGTLVDVIHRCGETYFNEVAGELGGCAESWTIDNVSDDIVAWRLSSITHIKVEVDPVEVDPVEVEVEVEVDPVETDPFGKDAHEPGSKLDAGKVKAGVLHDFSGALFQIAQVGTYGAEKYTRGGWQHVPDAEMRYFDAFWRHVLASRREECDKDTGLKHLAHAAWNILAVLEISDRVG